MRARLARHAIILSLVVAALAASGVAQWPAADSAPAPTAPVGVALRQRARATRSDPPHMGVSSSADAIQGNQPDALRPTAAALPGQVALRPV